MKAFARFLTVSMALALGLPLGATALPLPAPPDLAAKSYVLIDFASGQVLAAKSPEGREEPASLTKLMLVYVAFDELKQGRLKPTDEVLVSEKAWRQGIDSKESRMFIEVGKRVSVQDLLHGIVIQSGNDACVALAEHLGGTEDVFAGVMNQYTAKLGMTHTHYMNANGVPDPGQYTSALDVARLSRALIRDFPDQYPLFAQKDFVFNKIHQSNRNLLLWRDPSVDGIKTGHAEKAGYHLAASALRDGRRLISVVMGMASEKERAEASLSLLNYGFRFYETVPAVAAHTPLATIRAWKGEQTELALGVANAMIVSVPHGGAARLQVKTQVNEPVYAPITAGQPLGTVTVSLDGKVLSEQPLVALTALPEGGLMRRMSDEVQLWIHDLM